MATMPVDTCDQHDSAYFVAAEYGIPTLALTLRRSRRAHPERERCVVCHAPATRHYSARWEAAR